MNEEGYFSASSTSTDVTERALFPYRSFRRISFQSVIRARLVLSARPIYLSRLLIGVHSYSRFHIFLKSNRENCFPLCMQYPVFYPLRSDNNILFFFYSFHLHLQVSCYRQQAPTGNKGPQREKYGTRRNNGNDDCPTPHLARSSEPKWRIVAISGDFRIIPLISRRLWRYFYADIPTPTPPIPMRCLPSDP